MSALPVEQDLMALHPQPSGYESRTPEIQYVSWAELPLSCPRPTAPLWNAHPRIYLPIHKSGLETCPYCGAIYILRPADERDEPSLQTRLDIDAAFHEAHQRVCQGDQ